MRAALPMNLPNANSAPNVLPARVAAWPVEERGLIGLLRAALGTGAVGGRPWGDRPVHLRAPLSGELPAPGTS